MRPLSILVALSCLAAIGACGCNESAQSGCMIDDDCRAVLCPTGYIPTCDNGMCGCGEDVPLGDIGRFETIAMRGDAAYVAAYNTTYGDLMIGHVTPPGRVANWEFVDGVPTSSTPDQPLSQVRGGITDPGDDVGKYTSIAVDAAGDPLVAYYDATNQSLKLATFGAVAWHAQVVDQGAASKTGDDMGRYASLTLGRDGSPGIAYYAEVARGASGMREGQLRFAQASTPNPTAPSDWHITVIDTRPIPPPADPAVTPILPDGIALFVASARKPDFGPAIAYYDRARGNLRFVEYDSVLGKFGTPVILDGEDAMGRDTGDVGQYPSVAVDGDGVSHISYVDSSRANLLYVESRTRTPEVIDDGYRAMDETTGDGLPAPVYHLVGDSSSIQVGAAGIFVAYGDSTVLQLRLAARDPAKGTWKTLDVAGHGSPFAGSYGLYAQARLAGTSIVLSSYAIDQHQDPTLFYVETFALPLGAIM